MMHLHRCVLDVKLFAQRLKDDQQRKCRKRSSEFGLMTGMTHQREQVEKLQDIQALLQD
jgi:hypothetical protein